jgi:FkbM family methyltransferase
MNSQHLGPQILLRAWPFPRGAGWIIDRFFGNLSFNEEIATVKTTDGFPLSVMPNELIGRHLYLTGEFDRTTVEVLLKYAVHGDTLLDIGANIGYVTACFLAKVPGSRAIAVEPQPEIVDLLTTNLQQFNGRASVAPVALSDHEGESFLLINRLNRGASKIVSSARDQTVKVEMWSPERLLEKFGPTKIDLVKIDVEGQEETVFRALESSLLKYQPRLIMFEDHKGEAAPTAPIGLLLNRLGYSVFGVKKRLTKLEFPSIRSSADCEHNDYIALATSPV